MTSWRTYRIPGIYETLEFGTPVILVSPTSGTPAIPWYPGQRKVFQNLKVMMTPRCPGHWIFTTPWYPGYRKIATPQCPGVVLKLK